MVVGPLLHPQPLVNPHCAAGCLVAQVVVGPAMLLLAEVVITLGRAMLGALLGALLGLQCLGHAMLVSPAAMLGARSLGNVAELVQWAPKASPQQTLIYLGQMQVQCTHPPSCLYIQWHCQVFLS